jgi:general secretion pathway protein J
MLEMVIVMGVLAMIGTMSAGILSQVVDGSERAMVITDHYHQVRQALLRMSREIQMAFVSEHRDCDDPRTKTIFRGERTGTGTRLDFTSFSHFKIRADANESDQNELSYFIDQDPSDAQKKALFRREAHRIDAEPTEGGMEKVLAHGVTALSFQFYDGKEDRWEDEWDSTSQDFKGRLPTFVKIHMTVENHRGEEEAYTTKTRVFLRRPLRILGTGFAPCAD